MPPAPRAEPWTAFGDCFARLGRALSYEPVFMGYYHNAFETLIDDGVTYVEIRTGIGSLYNDDGDRFQGEQFVEKLLELRAEIRDKHPEFDFKIIISDWRGGRPEDIWGNVRRAFQLRAKYPNFIVGYDLVGHEDSGRTLEAFLDVWLSFPMFRRQYKTDLPLYFHAGETNWGNVENLYDAYLLRSRRVGHALNLEDFPRLQTRFARRPLPIEVCPVSNQVLGYVRDLRLHPANQYIRRGMPCVLASDDPCVFGNRGLSYDFWIAMTAWQLDLLTLKQLAQNSINYSAMTPAEKEAALTRWQSAWTEFIADIHENRERAPRP